MRGPGRPIASLAAALAMAASASTMKRASAADAPRQSTESFTFTQTVSATYSYLKYLPKDYAAGSGQKWPLVLFLHGAGERGTDPSRVAFHGPPKLVAKGKDLPFVLVSPQCPPNQRWNDAALLALLDHVVASHAIDTNRVCLTGLSMGGYGTWSLGTRNPERFAALAPICGGGRVIDVLLADDRARELKAMPVWAFHGDADNVVPLSESRAMVEGLQRLGNKGANLTVYPGVGHDSWTRTYDDPEFMKWLLAQTREGRFGTRKAK